MAPAKRRNAAAVPVSTPGRPPQGPIGAAATAKATTVAVELSTTCERPQALPSVAAGEPVIVVGLTADVTHGMNVEFVM